MTQRRLTVYGAGEPADADSFGEGNAGDVLTRLAPPVAGAPPPFGWLPGAGGTVVASFFVADVVDVSIEPALNGVFYTAPADGWFRLTWVLTTFGVFQPGVDSAQINAFVGAPSVDSPQVNPSLRLYQGGEGTQAAQFCTPADVYLKTGQTLQLQGAFGTHMTVGIQLTRVL